MSQSSGERRTADYSPEQERARMLYMARWSYRDIAKEVLPDQRSGHVTIYRWVKRFGWELERAELEAEARDAQKSSYLQTVAVIQERQLRIARKAQLAAELALDAYFEYDEFGKPVG